MPVLEILKATTYSPAKMIGALDEIGTLEVGSRADVAIFDIVKSPQEFYDQFGNRKKGDRVFAPLMTMREGRIVFRQIYFYD